LRNIAYSIPNFGPMGENFSGFQIVPFGLCGPSKSLQNFNYLPHLEWISFCGKFLYLLFPPFCFTILASESCLTPSKPPNNDFYANNEYVEPYKLNIALLVPLFRNTRYYIFRLLERSLWLGLSLYKSTIFQLSTSSRSRLASLDKHLCVELNINFVLNIKYYNSYIYNKKFWEDLILLLFLHTPKVNSVVAWLP
jgi:hypothetical protein